MPKHHSAQSLNSKSKTAGRGFSNPDPRLGVYAETLLSPTDDVLTAVLERCRAANLPAMEMHPMDGQHLEVLVRATNAGKVVEVGTLGGYSGVCIARALPAHGKLFTCEINARHAAIARENFRAAGVDSKVEVLVGPAEQTLSQLSAQGPFDLVFIDADKMGYPNYARWAEEHLRVGGTLVADNTFAWGLVLQEKIDNPDHALPANAMRAFNLHVGKSPRFVTTLFPTGEGLLVAVKIA